MSERNGNTHTAQSATQKQNASAPHTRRKREEVESALPALALTDGNEKRASEVLERQ
jgi:hypothetical protein